MLLQWFRAACALLICSCYNPSPVEGLGCSETGQCPSGQSCDPAFQQCVAFPRCPMPAISEAFSADRLPCPWGRQFGDTIVDVDGDSLVLTPSAGFANSGGCEASAPIPFEDGGIFLEVRAVMPPGHGFVELTAQTAQGGGPDQPTITAHDGMLELTTPDGSAAAAPYDPVAMRWWRIRPDRAARTSVAEYAADGYHWTRLGAIDVPPQDEIGVEFSAGVNIKDPAPTSARVANLDICPPR